MAVARVGIEGHVADNPDRIPVRRADRPHAFWPETGPPSPIIGWALDGFPVYGLLDPDTGKAPEGLDECSGKEVTLADGTKSYRYHTQTVSPYTVTCWKGKPADEIKKQTENVFDYTCTGLFERHKLAFAMQMNLG